VAFDIEVVFIYLWALIFRDPKVDAGSLFISMLVFVGILLFGLAYAWRKGKGLPARRLTAPTLSSTKPP